MQGALDKQVGGDPSQQVREILAQQTAKRMESKRKGVPQAWEGVPPPLASPQGEL